MIEDLNMKGLSQALHFGKSFHDNGWGMFSTFLEYKLKQQGKQLVKKCFSRIMFDQINTNNLLINEQKERACFEKYLIKTRS